jgi:hypothetical protein
MFSPTRVARRRDEPESGQQLEHAVDRHVVRTRRVDPLADGVVVLAARVVDLAQNVADLKPIRWIETSRSAERSDRRTPMIGS